MCNIYFQAITDNIYNFGRPFCSLIFYLFTTHPPIFLPIHIGFYPSKRRVAKSLGTLHKSMAQTSLRLYTGDRTPANNMKHCINFNHSSDSNIHVTTRHDTARHNTTHLLFLAFTVTAGLWLGEDPGLSVVINIHNTYIMYNDCLFNTPTRTTQQRVQERTTYLMRRKD